MGRQDGQAHDHGRDVEGSPRPFEREQDGQDEAGSVTRALQVSPVGLTVGTRCCGGSAMSTPKSRSSSARLRARAASGS